MKRYLLIFNMLVILALALAPAALAEETVCQTCGLTAGQCTLESFDASGHNLLCACGTAYTFPHSWSEWQSTGDGSHTRICAAGCSESDECSGGTATCSAQAVCDNCTTPYGTVAAEAHVWDEGVVMTEASCSAEGLIRYTCTLDGSHTKEETIPVNDEHVWDEGVVVTEASCSAEGLIRYTCTLDGSHTKDEAIPVNDAHVWDEGVITRESTCRTPGILTYTCLNSSEHTYTEELPIDPEAHFFRDSVVLQAATCSQEGIISYTCLYSASHVVQETLPINPDVHRWDGGVVTRVADCVNTGETVYTCLDNPEHTKTETTPVDLSSHPWGERTVTLEATCTRSGEITLICELDANHTGTETIPPIGHNWTISTVTKEATCEETGVITYTCANDASHTMEETIPALGHLWGNMKLISEPTCTTHGSKSYICGRDIDHTTTVRIAIDPNAHSYTRTEETVVIPGVCRDGEAYILQCSECGSEDLEMIAEPQNHVFSQWTSSDGYHVSVCDACETYTVRILCPDSPRHICPICRDGEISMTSVYGVTAVDSAEQDDYTVSVSAGSGLMHLALCSRTDSGFTPAEFASPVKFSLNAKQISAALQGDTGAQARRAVAILNSDDCRILRNDDLVMLCTDDDAVLLRLYVHVPGDTDELFCRIDNGVITFTLREKHIADGYFTVCFALEDK